MCGRFTLFVAPDELSERFGVEVPASYEPSYNVAPGQPIPTVDGGAGFRHREWGLVPEWADDPTEAGYVNARAETVEDRSSFRSAVARRRCLVPADGFYEWTDAPGGRQPYRIARADDRPFAMAGIWERWEGQREQAGLDDFADGEAELETDVRETVAIVTTAASEPVAELHDRMPAILPADREREWLDAAEPGRRERLLSEPVADDLWTYPVSTAVNDPARDSPELIEPADA